MGKTAELKKSKVTSFVVTIDKDRCKGCGLCIMWCPRQCLEPALDLNKRGIHYIKQKKKAVCSGCGICYLVCPDWCIDIYEKT